MPTPRKLTYATAMQIRQLKRENPSWSPRIILEHLQLPCSVASVHFILIGRTYNTRIQNRRSKSHLTPDDIIQIRGYINSKLPLEWIALKYKVTTNCIQRIKYRLTWADVKSPYDTRPIQLPAQDSSGEPRRDSLPRRKNISKSA